MGCRNAAGVEHQGDCDRGQGRVTYAQGRTNSGQGMASTLGRSDSMSVCQVVELGRMVKAGSLATQKPGLFCEDRQVNL